MGIGHIAEAASKDGTISYKTQLIIDKKNVPSRTFKIKSEACKYLKKKVDDYFNKCIKQEERLEAEAKALLENKAKCIKEEDIEVYVLSKEERLERSKSPSYALAELSARIDKLAEMFFNFLGGKG